MPFAFSGLAAIATERGETDRAATLVGAAEAIMEAQHMAWPPDERPHYERLLAVLPETMGAAEFARARAAGRALATEDAVAFALGTTADRLADDGSGGLVPHTGFEPVISALRGRCPGPLDECGPVGAGGCPPGRSA